MNYISSIQNPAPGKFMVAKSPVEDFNNGSILTVLPGEQAIFVNNGVVAGIFLNGRYELTTQNYPFINAFRRFLANGNLTYHCSIFFISETQSSEILWGFPLQVRDPIQNVFTKLFVRGSYTLRLKDGGKLLLQLLGMNVNFMAADDCKVFFGNRFQQQISNKIAKFISDSNREIIELCNDNLGVTDEISPQLADIVEYSGLEIVNFSIGAMQIDVNDPNRRLLEMAYAKKREMEIMGGHYSTIKETEMRMNASSTPFAGYPNAPAQPSMVGLNMSGVPPIGLHTQKTPSPQYIEPTSKIDVVEKLQQLGKLKEACLITDVEYENLKSKLLSQIL